MLEVPMSKLQHWGDRAFSVSGHKLWNKLPSEMRIVTDLGLFESRLKTHLFKVVFST